MKFFLTTLVLACILAVMQVWAAPADAQKNAESHESDAHRSAVEDYYDTVYQQYDYPASSLARRDEAHPAVHITRPTIPPTGFPPVTHFPPVTPFPPTVFPPFPPFPPPPTFPPFPPPPTFPPFPPFPPGRFPF